MRTHPCKNVSMPSIDENAKQWQLEMSARVGRAVQEARKALGWTAQELSIRTYELGYPVTRVAISKIESNSRAGKLDLGELVSLAAALDIPPVLLLYPGYPDLDVEVLPSLKKVTSSLAARWFSGIAAMRGVRRRNEKDSATSKYVWLDTTPGFKLVAAHNEILAVLRDIDVLKEMSRAPRTSEDIASSIEAVVEKQRTRFRTLLREVESARGMVWNDATALDRYLTAPRNR